MVIFDYPSAEALGITGSDIVTALGRFSRNEIVGLVSEDGEIRTVRLSAGSDRKDDFSDFFSSIPVKQVGQRIVSLDEIAECRYQESQPEYYFRLNGLNTVTLSIDVVPDANLLTVAASVRKTMEELGAS